MEFVVDKLLQAARPVAALDFVYFSHRRDQDLDPNWVLSLLERCRQTESIEPPAAWFDSTVSRLIKLLQEAGSIDETRLARLEWEFLPLLDRHSSETRPVTLVQSSPRFLVDLLIAIYKADGDNSGDDDDVEISEAAFRRAHDLLEHFDTVPGRNSDGSIDTSVFNTWIDEVRTLSEAAKRRVVCDLFLGKLLAPVPIELQASSAFRVVASALERIQSQELLNGYQTGLFNSRGVTTRMPTDGGRLERDVADRYRTIARVIRGEFPSVAAVFDSVVRHYEREGKSHDVIAERRQLGR